MDWFDRLDFGDGWGAVAFALALFSIALSLVGRRSANRRTDQLIEHIGGMKEVMERQAQRGQTKTGEKVARIWLTENPTKNRFILRNMGPGTATGVEVDTSRIKCLVRDLPPKFDLAENQGQPFVMIGTFQTGGPPSEIWVRSDQEPEWSVVGLERWY